MKLEIGNNQGHVIIDDNTGKILTLLVTNVVEGKVDFRTFSSHTNHKDGTHTAIPPSLYVNPTTQQDEDEEAGDMRMRIIMQNGNTGEHYDLINQE